MTFATTRADSCSNGITKGELAQMYFPERSARGAVNGLADYIVRCTDLCDALTKTGYRRRQRILTPSQVALIYEYLGEP